MMYDQSSIFREGVSAFIIITIVSALFNIQQLRNLGFLLHPLVRDMPYEHDYSTIPIKLIV
jgi:hypothetical protein